MEEEERPRNTVHYTTAPMATTLTTPLAGNLIQGAVARRFSRARTTSRKSQPPGGVVAVVVGAASGRGSFMVSSEVEAKKKNVNVRIPRGQASALSSSSSRGPQPAAALPPMLDEAPALFQSVLVRGEEGGSGGRYTPTTVSHPPTPPMSRTPQTV